MCNFTRLELQKNCRISSEMYSLIAVLLFCNVSDKITLFLTHVIATHPEVRSR